MPSEARGPAAGPGVAAVPLRGALALLAAAAVGLLVAGMARAGHGPAALRVISPAEVPLLVATLFAMVTAATVSGPARAAGALAAGLAALVALAASPSAALSALLLLLVVAGQASLAGRRAFPARFRAPAAGALLLAGGGWLAHSGDLAAARVGAAALAMALAAVAGAVPFFQSLDPREEPAADAAAWPGLVAPVLAVSAVPLAGVLLAPGARGAFEAVAIALGVLNAAWGAAGAWTATRAAAAWRHSFLADWGLLLAGLGLAGAAGSAGAYLILVSLAAVRMPLYLCARPGLARGSRPRADLISVVAGVALAGVAPFSGFPARILILRAATATAWPLALLLGFSMLCSVPGSLRLARSLGGLEGRALWATRIALGVSLAMGVYPAFLLRAGGLGP